MRQAVRPFAGRDGELDSGAVKLRGSGFASSGTSPAFAISGFNGSNGWGIYGYDSGDGIGVYGGSESGLAAEFAGNVWIIGQLPISSWHYTNAPEKRHVGPMT